MTVEASLKDFQERFLEKASESNNEEVKEKSDSELFEERIRINKLLVDVPVRYKEVSFDTFIERNEVIASNKKIMLSYANRLIKGYSGNMLMVGTVGTGKTHLAISAIRHYAENANKERFSVGYSTLNDIFVMSKSFGDDDARHKLNRFFNCDLLVIDEVNNFITQMSDYDKSTLFDIFNKRYNNIKPTIIISNLNPSQIEKALGVQILSRLFQDDKNIIVFNDSDYRDVIGKGV